MIGSPFGEYFAESARVRVLPVGGVVQRYDPHGFEQGAALRGDDDGKSLFGGYDIHFFIATYDRTRAMEKQAQNTSTASFSIYHPSQQAKQTPSFFG